MIDWDDVAESAETNPATILATFQGRADDIDGLVVIARFKDGKWRVDYSDGLLLALGLLDGGQQALRHDLMVRAMEEQD